MQPKIVSVPVSLGLALVNYLHTVCILCMVPPPPSIRLKFMYQKVKRYLLKQCNSLSGHPCWFYSFIVGKWLTFWYIHFNTSLNRSHVFKLVKNFEAHGICENCWSRTLKLMAFVKIVGQQVSHSQDCWLLLKLNFPSVSSLEQSWKTYFCNSSSHKSIFCSHIRRMIFATFGWIYQNVYYFPAKIWKEKEQGDLRGNCFVSTLVKHPVYGSWWKRISSLKSINMKGEKNAQLHPGFELGLSSLAPCTSDYVCLFLFLLCVCVCVGGHYCFHAAMTNFKIRHSPIGITI